MSIHLRWIPGRFSNSLSPFGLGVALLFLAQSAAGATLIGDEVDFDFQSPDVPQSAQNVLVVDPGVEFAIQFFLPPTDFLQVDVGASTITLTAVDTLFFFASEVLLVSDLDWVDFPSGEIAATAVQGSFSGACRPPFGCGGGGQPSVSLLDGHTVRIAFDANYPEDLWFTTGDVVTISLIPAIAVEIDIKPGSDPNSINPSSRGLIPVAILTTEDFDALAVDADSVLFGPAEAEKRHKRAHVEDVDGDGDLDLLLHFRTQETGIALGDTEACVTGETLDGSPFEGCDAMRTVPPN